MLANFIPAAILLALGLFAGMLLCLECGRRLGMYRLTHNPTAAKTTSSTLEASVFGLMGLLLAFSFGGAISRFDHRKDLIVEEANAIGTAWLRLDTLPAQAQPELRELFRTYVDERLAAYASLPDFAAAKARLDSASALQMRIWKAAVAACQTPEGQRAAIIVLPALNAMIDITTTRTMASKTHPPIVIFALLFGLALASCLLAGYDLGSVKTRSWIHALGFALVMTVTFYVILDIEYPRLGLIRVDDFDQVLMDVRNSMN